MPHVVLINPFAVPEGKDEAFLAAWEAAKAFMERQPGSLSTRLHRSLIPNTRFRFMQCGRVGHRRALSGSPPPPRVYEAPGCDPFSAFPRALRGDSHVTALPASVPTAHAPCAGSRGSRRDRHWRSTECSSAMGGAHACCPEQAENTEDHRDHTDDQDRNDIG